MYLKSLDMYVKRFVIYVKRFVMYKQINEMSSICLNFETLKDANGDFVSRVYILITTPYYFDGMFFAGLL